MEFLILMNCENWKKMQPENEPTLWLQPKVVSPWSHFVFLQEPLVACTHLPFMSTRGHQWTHTLTSNATDGQNSLSGGWLPQGNKEPFKQQKYDKWPQSDSIKEGMSFHIPHCYLTAWHPCSVTGPATHYYHYYFCHYCMRDSAMKSLKDEKRWQWWDWYITYSEGRQCV